MANNYFDVSQAELKEKLGKMYDVRDSSSVFVFGFRTQVCCPGLCYHLTVRAGCLYVVVCLTQPGSRATKAALTLLLLQCSSAAASLPDLA